jgi:secreted trypsin-like serine protease
MKWLVAIVALVSLCEARPRGESIVIGIPTQFEGVDSMIIGGTNAAVGAWPWQLSQQRSNSHSCGASLYKQFYALSAAHCVDGAAVNTLRVIAGLHDRSNTAGTVIQNLAGYTMHNQYNTGAPTYSNDIATLRFSGAINPGNNIAYAVIPANNNNDYAGSTCVITGWGRTSSANTLPNILQQASVGILSQAQCVQQAGGANIWANHICIKDSQNTRGACNGDSGGPINCPSGSSYVVTGIASFVFQSGGNCLPTSPSVYTRVSAYLAWINTNTP